MSKKANKTRIVQLDPTKPSHVKVIKGKSLTNQRSKYGTRFIIADDVDNVKEYVGLNLASVIEIFSNLPEPILKLIEHKGDKSKFVEDNIELFTMQKAVEEKKEIQKEIETVKEVIKEEAAVAAVEAEIKAEEIVEAVEEVIVEAVEAVEEVAEVAIESIPTEETIEDIVAEEVVGE